MDKLFDIEETPQEKGVLLDWHGDPIPTSDNPMVRTFGADPQGRKCKDCTHLLRNRYHGTTYIKCELRGITRGAGTDHRVKWDACKKYEEREAT